MGRPAAPSDRAIDPRRRHEPDDLSAGTAAPRRPRPAGAAHGEIATPIDANWDEARQAWNLAVDQRPAAVVYAASVDDVVATTRFAREHGLRVAPQGTGHNASPLGDLGDTILLK